MKPTSPLKTITGILLVLMTWPIPSHGETRPAYEETLPAIGGQGTLAGQTDQPGPESHLLFSETFNTLQDTATTACLWDLDPAEPDGDIDGFDLIINETIYAITISTRDRVSSSSSRTMNNRWTSGGKVYQLLNVQIQRSFRDGRPHELDTVWSAQRTLLCDGVQIGQLKFGPDPTLTFLEIYLETGDGRKILIEKWHTHVT